MSGSTGEAGSPVDTYNIEADRQAGLKRVQSAQIDETTRKELIASLQSAQSQQEIGATIPILEAASEGTDGKYKQRRASDEAIKLRRDQPGLSTQTSLLRMGEAAKTNTLLGGK